MKIDGSQVTLVPQCLFNITSKVERLNTNNIDDVNDNNNNSDNKIEFRRTKRGKTNSDTLQLLLLITKAKITPFLG